MERNQSLIVRQSLFFNLLIAAIFLTIFVGVMFTIKGQEKFTTPDYIEFTAMFFVPGIGAIYIGSRRMVVFKINDEGIFYYKKLITSWDRFIQAYAEEDNPEKGLDVKFSLYIQYYSTDTGIADLIKIPLPDTLDKSVEEIQSAIESFSANKI